MITCEKCGQKTSIGYNEWLNLTKVMLTFASLEQSQKETILLMVDGMRYRMMKEEQKDPAKVTPPVAEEKG
jgi:hypothetical protein